MQSKSINLSWVKRILVIDPAIAGILLESTMKDIKEGTVIAGPKQKVWIKQNYVKTRDIVRIYRSVVPKELAIKAQEENEFYTF